MPRRDRVVCLMLLGLFIPLWPAPTSGSRAGVPRLIVVVWDGAQRNHLQELYNSGDLPNLRALVEGGGLLRLDLTIHSETCEPGSGDGYLTQTGPAGSALLTGYGYPDQANQNNLDPHPIPPGYSFYERLKAAHPEVKTGLISAKVISCWPTPPLLNAMPAVDYWFQHRLPPSEIGPYVIQFLTLHHDDPFFLYVHHSSPDYAGHVFGENSPKYDEYLIAADTALGVVLAELAAFGIRDETRILVTTDHGFEEGGNYHRLCIDDNRDVWIAADRSELISKATVVPYQTSLGPTLFDIFHMDKNVSPRFYAESLYDDGIPPIPALQPIDNPHSRTDYQVEWMSVTGALTYTLEEAGDPGFSTRSIRYAGPDLQVDVAGQAPGTWFYRVQAINTAGSSPWSNVQPVAVNAWLYLPLVLRTF